uniref:IF rod domain-containing protein n=1 Tax=Aotus nancymaae TaxID=37293 RepID=A0A2K5BVE1_AOTNA
MSFGWEHYVCSSSSYRKVFGDGSHLSACLSGVSGVGGFCSQSLSRCNVASSTACSSASVLGFSLAYRRPVASDGLDLSEAAGINEYKIIRNVHQLETQNRALEGKKAALWQRHAEPSCVGVLVQRQLRAQQEEARSAYAQAPLGLDGLAEEVQWLRARCEEESRGREGTKRALKVQQRDVDSAMLACLDLEQKVESLWDELALVRQAAAEVDVTVVKPDLSSALREIRAQYESLVANNLQSSEEWYKSKFANLNEQVAPIQASCEEIHEYRRQLQVRTIEIEGLRGASESLERQILELEERHSEVTGYQDSTGQLENNPRNTKSEMARHFQECQDLLVVKMALDFEITAHRKLLEGEETRLSTSGVSISGPNPLPSPSSLLHLESSVLQSPKKQEEAYKVVATKTSQIGESFEEILEKTVISTKKIEISNIEEMTISSQKI